jgi:hypothetical protein
MHEPTKQWRRGRHHAVRVHLTSDQAANARGEPATLCIIVHHLAARIALGQLLEILKLSVCAEGRDRTGDTWFFRRRIAESCATSAKRAACPPPFQDY